MKIPNIRVRVPATSANVGAGFDCMGIALELWNYLEVMPAARLEVVTDKELPADGENLAVKTMKKVFSLRGREMPPFKLVQTNNIPVGSGLGSSAACIAGGAVLANLILGAPLSDNEILDFCARDEGHPDNVVPALTGGITASAITDDKVIANVVIPEKKLKVVCFTPDYEMLTATSRQILPKSYPREDAVYNLARALLTFKALEEGNIDIIGEVVGDRLHEQYRYPLIRDAEDIVGRMRAAGVKGVYLSGAGPTIAGFVPDGFPVKLSIPGGTVRVLDLAEKGAGIG